jgi:hypothetical protein
MRNVSRSNLWMPVEAILRSAFQPESTRSAGHVVNKPNPIVSDEVTFLARFCRCIAETREVQSARFNLQAAVSALPFFMLERTVRSRTGRAVETDLHTLALLVNLWSHAFRHQASFVAATAFPLAHVGAFAISGRYGKSRTIDLVRA